MILLWTKLNCFSYRNPTSKSCVRGRALHCLHLSIATQQHSLQLLMTKIFKTKKNLNMLITRNIYTQIYCESHYRSGSENHLQLPTKIQQHIAQMILNTDPIHFGLHCQMELNILAYPALKLEIIMERRYFLLQAGKFFYWGLRLFMNVILLGYFNLVETRNYTLLD